MHLCVFFHCGKYFICSYQSNHTVHCTLLPPRSPLRAPSRPSAKAPGSTPRSQQRWGGWKPQPVRSPFPIQEKPGQDTKRGDPTQKSHCHGESSCSGPLTPPHLWNIRLCFLCLQWHWLWGPLCPAPSYVFRSPPPAIALLTCGVVLASSDLLLLSMSFLPLHTFPSLLSMIFHLHDPYHPLPTFTPRYIFTGALMQERMTGLIKYS